MSARKLQQEVERTFKRVAEGIASFESIYDKLQQCTNSSQKEKLEDSLKREIKKLQRHRDQIKTWVANPEIKDKQPLLDQRKLIETQMEKFKAVEKEMKTKAYSKEGLLASARLDPRAQQKQDLVNFLADCTSELERQIEACEAESESLSATMKRGKKADQAKAERIAEVERLVERHKWHQQKLELIMRLLENGQLEVEQVNRVKDEIQYYVKSNQDVNFAIENDENIYDELDLDEEVAEDMYGMGLESERMSSQDTTSVQDDPERQPPPPKEAVRRPSTQLKSPMPAVSQLHQPSSSPSFGTNGSPSKPAPLPPRPAGELKYASVATAAAAAEKNVGIAPLPPPPGQAPVGFNGVAPMPPPEQPRRAHRQSSSSSTGAPLQHEKAPASPEKSQSTRASKPREDSPPAEAPEEALEFEEPTTDRSPSPSETDAQSHVNGAAETNGTYGADSTDQGQDESIFHLPPSLQDLMTSFEATKKRLLPNHESMGRSLELSYLQAPDSIDAEKPKHYKPTQKYNTPVHYPQEPLPIFEDPALYKKVDSDTLFYVFYYRQGTYQQYLAAKELKRQSWRFHKQYQTWFQRHEEPKTITEEYEQGTYRFFDYESTWMNRRKSDFKFVYKYLEDDN